MAKRKPPLTMAQIDAALSRRYQNPPWVLLYEVEAFSKPQEESEIA